MKQHYADKWSTDVLEQIASCCNVASNSQNTVDWGLFLNAIHRAALALPNVQRTILLLSQEHGLSFSDICRVLNMPHPTVMVNMRKAVDSIVAFMKRESLINITLRHESKVAAHVYCEKFITEVPNEPSRFGYYYDVEPPWFYDVNILLDDGGEQK